MKNYKAFIIDGRKLIRGFLAVLLTIILLFCIFSSIFNNNSLLKIISSEQIISNTLPSVAVANSTGSKPNFKNLLHKGVFFLLGIDSYAPEGVISAQLPMAKLISRSALSELAQSISVPPPPLSMPEIPQGNDDTSNPIPPENQAPIKEMNLAPNKDGSKKIVLGNETSYSVNIEEMLSSPPSVDMSKKGPKVLVIHTHGSESYSPQGSVIYDMTSSDRNTDTEKNVVKAGEVLCQILNEKGIQTLHDKTLHDYPSYNGSYASSLESMEKYLEKYPSIQIILDIHRDSIVYSDHSKAKAVCDIDGKTAAQLMFVVGTDEKGLSHPNWRENLKTAIHFQNAINQRYPNLMRHINLRQERFNGHTTPGSMIIETGSSGNTLTEALYGISLAANCIGDYLLTLK